MPARVVAYIGIGSNLGDARGYVERALVRLAHLSECTLQAQSSLFRTMPIDAGGEHYVNAVACLHTGLPAPELLAQLQAIELACGRERPYVNAPRTLDLDVLLYGGERIDTATLTVPHPRLTQRAFVLIPLLQIDPFVQIPGSGPAHAFVPGVAGQLIEKLQAG